MKKGLVALVLGFSSVAFGQLPEQQAAPPQEPVVAEEFVPSPVDVRDRLLEKGVGSGYSEVIKKPGAEPEYYAVWYTLSLDDLFTFSVFTGNYDVRNKTLTLCSYFQPAKKDATDEPVILGTCVTDKGLDGKPGGCYVGMVTLENTLHHALFRDLPPIYALSAMQPGDKEHCAKSYVEIRKEIMRLPIVEDAEPQK